MKLRNIQASFWKDQSGASSLEYGFLLALIAIVCIASFTFTGEQVEASYSHTVSKMPKH